MATTAEPPRPGGSGAPGARRRLRMRSWPTTGRRSTGSPRTPASGPSPATCARRSSGCCGQPVTLTCAGRTDAGVHARGQVVTFDVVGRRRPTRCACATPLNALLGPAGRRAGRSPRCPTTSTPASRRAGAGTATWCSTPRCPTRSWPTSSLVGPASRSTSSAMNRAAHALVGEHDFSSFCRRPRQDARGVARAPCAPCRMDPRPSRLGGASRRLLRFEIVASAFCHQMVRSIVGALVEVGRGRMPPEQVGVLLAARDRGGRAEPGAAPGPDAVGGGLRAVGCRRPPGDGPHLPVGPAAPLLCRARPRDSGGRARSPSADRPGSACRTPSGVTRDRSSE